MYNNNTQSKNSNFKPVTDGYTKPLNLSFTLISMLWG